MKIDRWNGNTLRRYHHSSGAILVIHVNSSGKCCKVIPASCRHISADVSRAEALALLKEIRS